MKRLQQLQEETQFMDEDLGNPDEEYILKEVSPPNTT